MSKREIVNHPGAVAIIAITDEGKLCLLSSIVKALEKAIIEIPAGKLEPGEKPEVTAVRELEEKQDMYVKIWSSLLLSIHLQDSQMKFYMYIKRQV